MTRNPPKIPKFHEMTPGGATQGDNADGPPDPRRRPRQIEQALGERISAEFGDISEIPNRTIWDFMAFCRGGAADESVARAGLEAAFPEDPDRVGTLLGLARAVRLFYAPELPGQNFGGRFAADADPFRGDATADFSEAKELWERDPQAWTRGK